MIRMVSRVNGIGGQLGRRNVLPDEEYPVPKMVEG